jgi:nitrogenase-stabilizing/protective protein
MTGTLDEFRQLTDAEQYFEFFGLDYDPTIVNVNRLHILKQFSNQIRQLDQTLPELEPTERLQRYCTALLDAYTVFTHSSGVEQKLFKVFRQKPANVVLLSEINS